MSNRITRQSDSRDSDTNRRAFTFALNSCYRGHVCCSSLACAACQLQQAAPHASHASRKVGREDIDRQLGPASLSYQLSRTSRGCRGSRGRSGCAVARAVSLPMHIHSPQEQTQESESEQRRFSTREGQKHSRFDTVLYFFGELAFERNLGL